MHDDESELMIGMKAAQMGFTEVALNKSFFANDIEQESVLYVLPTDSPDASNFSTSRFDPALEMSPHLANLYSDVKNVGHKRAGSANLFIVGSRSRSRLKSNPCARTIADEVEEMVQANIALIPERMAGQLNQQMFMLSTPSLPGKGIHRYYNDSSQNHYMFKCPSCSRMTELVFPNCLVITADSITDAAIRNTHLICKECKNILPHESKVDFLSLNNSEWVQTYTDRMSSGYQISQLYSMMTKPYQVAISYMKGLNNPYDEQEFWNSKLGLPHEVEGARITDEKINNCIGTTLMYDTPPENAFITMGVDVGKKLHCWIDQWFFDKNIHGPDIHLVAKCRTLRVLTVTHFYELDKLIYHYRILQTVIDINPERRSTLEIAQRLPGLIRRCEYQRGIRGSSVNISNEEDEYKFSADRTSWLDLSLGRFHNKSIILPRNLPQEARDHIKTLVRVYKKDQDGNETSIYNKDENEPDHYAHARNYSEMALRFAASMSQNRDISGVL